MDKEQIKAVLRNRAGELRPLGIVHLHLHGSQVNGHARPDPDIDLAASFDRTKVRTMLDEIAPTLPRTQELANGYVDAYRRYCWPVYSISDFRLAPFHLLASANRVYSDADHNWHMEVLARLAAADPDLLRALPLATETGLFR